jgi:hypothetical protein
MYSKMAVGFGFSAKKTSNLIQVLGIDSGNAQVRVASMQADTSIAGDWRPSGAALLNVASTRLHQLVVASGFDGTYALGLGSDGNIYRLGTQLHEDSWQSGGGILQNSTTFSPVCGISAALGNSSEVFAISNVDYSAWVAAYHNEGEVGWNPGFVLPGGKVSNFMWVGARPDLSEKAVVHAIGLNLRGNPYEIAVQSGSGVGSQTWSAGVGELGDQERPYSLLLLITGDSQQTFHVIGMGQDGSVWDVDQYSATASTPAWSKKSVQIAPSGTISTHNPIFDYVLDQKANVYLITQEATPKGEMQLVQFASLVGDSWKQTSSVIPASRTTSYWSVVTNLAAGTSTSSPSPSFILGLSHTTGHIYELAYTADGVNWTKGQTNAISA